MYSYTWNLSQYFSFSSYLNSTNKYEPNTSPLQPVHYFYDTTCNTLNPSRCKTLKSWPDTGPHPHSEQATLPRSVIKNLSNQRSVGGLHSQHPVSDLWACRCSTRCPAWVVDGRFWFVYSVGQVLRSINYADCSTISRLTVLYLPVIVVVTLWNQVVMNF